MSDFVVAHIVGRKRESPGGGKGSDGGHMGNLLLPGENYDYICEAES